MGHYLCLFFVFLVRIFPAQENWMLQIRSTVELRKLKLTNRAELTTRPLKAATIVLLQGTKVIQQASSDGTGDFTISVPPGGEYDMVISYAGCNSKKFHIATNGVPETFDKEGWEPDFPIGGVIMARPLPGIDYSALDLPMAKIFFKQKGKVFDDDGDYTDQILKRLKQIKSDEDALISKFLEAVQGGDRALAKPDCPLAKSLYEKALVLIPGEEYPIAQLKMVGECLDELEKSARAQTQLQEKNNKEEMARKQARQERMERERDEAARVEKEKVDALAKRKAEAAQRELEAAAELRMEREKEQAAALERQAQEKIAHEKAELERLNQVAQEKAAKEKAAEMQVNRRASEKVTELKSEEAERSRKAEEKARKEKEEAGAMQKDPATNKKNVESHEGISVRASEPGRRRGRLFGRKSRHSVRHVIGISEYNRVVAEADASFDEKQYEKAGALYSKALNLKPLDVYATERLHEIRMLNNKQRTE